jgi:hypothetical protein
MPDGPAAKTPVANEPAGAAISFPRNGRGQCRRGRIPGCGWTPPGLAELGTASGERERLGRCHFGRPLPDIERCPSRPASYRFTIGGGK